MKPTRLLLLAWVASSPVAAQSPLPVGHSLGFAANDRICWVYQDGAEPDVKSVSKFAYRMFGDRPTGTYRRGPVTTGRVAHAAVRGTDIHVFFSDGTHWRFAPIQIGITVASPRAREMDLPDSALPIALAVDEQRDCLFAVVNGAVGGKVRVAEQMEKAAAAEKERDRESGTSKLDRSSRSNQLLDTG